MVEELKRNFAKFTRQFFLSEVILAGVVAVVIGYQAVTIDRQGKAIETQREVYRAAFDEQAKQQDRLYGVLYARMQVMKLLARKVGATDEEIREAAGPDAFTMPDPVPLNLGDL
jgi:hypothetical protein